MAGMPPIYYHGWDSSRILPCVGYLPYITMSGMAPVYYHGWDASRILPWVVYGDGQRSLVMVADVKSGTLVNG